MEVGGIQGISVSLNPQCMPMFGWEGSNPELICSYHCAPNNKSHHVFTLQDQLELSIREKSGLHETERQLLLKIKTMQSCLKTEKDEV